ncbi:MAG: archaellin/type IV pilin N-terminal domain-containing protein [Thermoplasmata archaeon]
MNSRIRRRRLRRGRRGVSPIIATILLVAITVIIAAVLYTLLIPLLGHSTTPLQSNFSFGPAQPETGTGAAGCAVGDYCWEVQFGTLNQGISPSAISLYIQNTSGQTISTSGWNFTIVTVSGGVVASAHGPQAGVSQGWTAGPGYSTDNTLTFAMRLWIDTGSAQPQSPNNTLYAVGMGSWSGQVYGSLP